MAVQFHPLPVDVFPEQARPYIARLNVELRELFGLEGTIRNPIVARRSDLSVIRRAEPQVDVTRITPSVSTVVSGASTVVGIPALTFSTTNVAGSTTTAVSTNSEIALFGLQAPSGLSNTAAVGSSGFAARGDHVHEFPTSLQSSASDMTVELTDDAFNPSLTGSSGTLIFGSPRGFRMNEPSVSSINNTLTVRMNPAQGTFVGIVSNPESIWSGVTNATITTWDSVVTMTSGTMSTVNVALLRTRCTLSPSVGSGGSNKYYGLWVDDTIVGTTQASFTEVAGIRVDAPSRSLSAVNIPIVDAAGAIVECATIGTTAQYGVWIKNRSAQNTAAIRYGLKVDAQNSGTLRYSLHTATDQNQLGGNVACDSALGVTGVATFGVTTTIGGGLDHNGAVVGLYGATPTVQYGTSGTVSGHSVTTGTTVTHSDVFTGNTGTNAYTISDVVRALKLIGALTY